MPHDTFPELDRDDARLAEPGHHAPLVATGGTGNDEFIVYSNQAELRLEGDDDNDLFVVRAFALAAVCDTSADADADCDFADIDFEADPDTGIFPVDTNGSGTCTRPRTPATTARAGRASARDNNGDGVCNNADAHMTGAPTATTPADPTSGRTTSSRSTPTASRGRSSAWASRPRGRWTSARAAARTRSSTTSTRPVSVDGGTGFDKLVVLGTEFADDIVITVKGIFGAGLNVRYDNIEVVEVDGLEGDDEFFVLSTRVRRRLPRHRRPRLATRSTSPATSSRTSSRASSRASAARSTTASRRRSTSSTTACPSTASTTTSRRPTAACHHRRRGPRGHVGARGRLARRCRRSTRYSIRLREQPGHASTSRSRPPARRRRRPTTPSPTPSRRRPSTSLDDGQADTIWLCTPGPGGDVLGRRPTSSATSVVNGVRRRRGQPRARLHVRRRPTGSTRQWVYVLAVDDPRSEGDRVVVVQHTSISHDPRFDAVAVRNVEVSVRDNDTPGVYVTEITAGTCALACEEDKRTLTIEGADFMATYTGRTDELLVQLQKDPGALAIRVKLVLDAASQAAIQLTASTPRFGQARPRRRQPAAVLHVLHAPLHGPAQRLADAPVRRDGQRSRGRRVGGPADRRHHVRPRRPQRRRHRAEGRRHGRLRRQRAALRRRRDVRPDRPLHLPEPALRQRAHGGRGHRRRQRRRRLDRERHRHDRAEVRQRPVHDPQRDAAATGTRSG